LARPKVKQEHKRVHRVALYFDDYEWDLIQEKAKSVDVRMNVYLRTLCTRGHFRMPKYSKIDAAYISQFSRVIGMLKEFFNRSGGFMSDATAEIINDLRDVIKLIRAGAYHDREADTKPQDGI
jgi:hypothetical protein